jgi:hypothetical protein
VRFLGGVRYVVPPFSMLNSDFGVGRKITPLLLCCA